MIEIAVLGAPVAKGRPRFSRATGHVFTPARTANFGAVLRFAAIQAMGALPPLEGPLQVQMDVKVPIPASWPRRRQEAARAGRERPTKKPDADNFAKMLDAANLVVWIDDGQITDLQVRKSYSDKPGMFIRVQPIEGVFA